MKIIFFHEYLLDYMIILDLKILLRNDLIRNHFSIFEFVFFLKINLSQLMIGIYIMHDDSFELIFLYFYTIFVRI